MSKELEIPKDAECAVGVCGNPVVHYCPYCVDEYEFGPDVPSSCYCDEHYEKVVMTGNCCYGAEQAYRNYREARYDW
jgi:hypothetical protein